MHQIKRTFVVKEPAIQIYVLQWNSPEVLMGWGLNSFNFVNANLMLRKSNSYNRHLNDQFPSVECGWVRHANERERMYKLSGSTNVI